MKISNKHISVIIEENKIKLINEDKMQAIELNWPAVTLSIQGKEISPSGAPYKTELSKKSFTQYYQADSLKFKITLELSAKSWFRKTVCVSGKKDLPTPDFLETDRQFLSDKNLKICGYRASKFTDVKKGQEEGSGIMPGCGYPIIGKDFFMGLEHPAAFNCMEKAEEKNLVWMRHFPIWTGTELQSIGEVFGWSDNPESDFMDYLKTIRLPALKKPLVSFCTFWADPYLGDREYAVSYDAYQAFIKAFEKHSLIPDAFTLDAGWNERQSIFQSKKDVGGDTGLIKLRKLVEKMGSSLSLWLSHNGPMGIDPEHMKKKGFEVGSGNSAAYCGDGYGVMMDKKFSKALENRFSALIEKVGAVHFKIDWDNDCATNSKFNDIYPTRDHVRQASINEYFRIARAMRSKNKNIVTRNGWWPSPWWLAEANHLWLPDSGDSEYSSVPGKTQRDSASTHRDVMYYNVLRRDKSALTLDCFDNHEFPDAFRNPFMEDKLSWTNAVWHSFFRGSTYVAYTIQPESLEQWQADSMKQIMKFCRAYAAKIFTENGKMVLGHPGKGEVYGFANPGDGETWCMLRNPLPVPQNLKIDFTEIASHKAASVLQFYPHCQNLTAEQPLSFMAHEIKLIIISDKKAKPLFDLPYMPEKKGSNYIYRFPASATLTNKVRPMAHELHQIKDMIVENIEKTLLSDGTTEYQFTPTIPYKMREMELQLEFKADKNDTVSISAYTSRYSGLNSCYALPVTEIADGVPGYGESKNPDSIFPAGKKYFSIKIPAGGQFGMTLRIKGLSEGSFLSGAWLAGYEAPSTEALTGSSAPMGLSKCLPYQNPLGFGKTLVIPIPE